MTRPKSIQQFEIIFFILMLGGFVSLALSWDNSLAVFRANPGSAQLGDGFFITLLLGSVAVGVAINLLLWFFITRKRSSVAKWIYVALFGIGLLGLLMGVAGGTLPVGVQLALNLLTFVVQAIAVWLLFRPDSNVWFARDAAPPADLGTTFD